MAFGCSVEINKACTLFFKPTVGMLIHISLVGLTVLNVFTCVILLFCLFNFKENRIVGFSTDKNKFKFKCDLRHECKNVKPVVSLSCDNHR